MLSKSVAGEYMAEVSLIYYCVAVFCTLAIAALKVLSSFVRYLISSKEFLICSGESGINSNFVSEFDSLGLSV